MVIKILKNFFKRIFSKIFNNKEQIKLGFYGPPMLEKLVWQTGYVRILPERKSGR
jgi:hypothetical protein